MANILDFNDNGGAIIEISQIYSEYSLVVIHWKSTKKQLQEIEQDILQSNSQQLTNFLKKYAEELQKCKELQEYDDEDDDEDYDEWWVSAFESEEEKQFWYDMIVDENIEYEEESGRICISNFRLKHSLAWYLMNCINTEIEKIEIEIEKQKGILIAINDIETTLKIIHESKSQYQAATDLMKHFSLSKLQAKAAANLAIRDISCQKEIERRIKFLELKKSFLEKLKA